MKKLKIALLVISLLLFLALAVAWFNLSAIVKSGIETLGPKLTKCPVTVGSVSLSPLTGSGTIQDLVVGNPEGFKTDHALRLGKIHVEVSVASLFADTLVVKEILVEAPEIIYEMGMGSSNIGTIQKNLAEASGGDKPADKKKEPDPEAGPGKRLRIDHILVKDGKISLSARLLDGNALPIPLPDVEMRDVGKEGDGATVAEVASAFFARLAAGIGEALKAGGSMIKDATGLLDDLGGLFKKK